MNTKVDKQSCHQCNEQHRPRDCRYTAVECYKRGRRGRVVRAYRSRPVGKGEQVLQISREGEARCLSSLR